MEDNAMPWNIKWLDDTERVLVLTPSDPWTWDDFKETTQSAQGLTKGKPYDVDIIFHLGDDLKMPKPQPGEQHVAAWVPMRDMLLTAPENRGVAVIVAAPLFIESTVRSLKAVIKDERLADSLKFAETMDEAQAIIRKARGGRDEG
jgi:hypothetical protein